MNRKDRRKATKTHPQAPAGAPPIDVRAILTEGLAHHQAGRLDQAEIAYRRLLAAMPDHPDALHLLGVAEHQRGHHKDAVELIERALKHMPQFAKARNNLGNALLALGREADAAQQFEAAIAIQPNNPEALSNLGNALRRLKRLPEARDKLLAALDIRPDFAEALSNLGLVLADQGVLEDALAAFRSALAINPHFPEAHNNEGLALLALGQREEAKAAFERALALKPNYPEARNNVGLALAGDGHFEEAIGCFRQALALAPQYADAQNNLGSALQVCGDLDSALKLFEGAVALKPDSPTALNNLGGALARHGRLEEAVDAFRKAITVKPDYSAAYNSLGATLSAQYRYHEAIKAFEKALELQPDYTAALNNLGNTLINVGRMGEAMELYRKAVELSPDMAEFHSNLGNALMAQGRNAEAEATLRHAVKLAPQLAPAWRNLMTCLLYRGNPDPEVLYTEARAFEAAVATPLYAKARSRANRPDPERPLRIGYLSSDFRSHPVARNMLPALKNRDRDNFKVFAYAEVPQADRVTQEVKELVDGWRSTVGQDDAAVAGLMQDDAIDILVVLAARFDANRPLIAALKPAPVQISYHDPGTSGLAAIDYLIGDPVLTPRHGRERFVERVVRIPTFYCHQPMDLAPDPGPLPCLQSGGVTFGSANNPAKITPETVAAWAKVLEAVPGSRLLMKYRWVLEDGQTRQLLTDQFAAHGIDPGRIDFRGGNAGTREHLAFYQEVDIALDTFPFTGSTTTFESLWMGTPVITIAGPVMVSRWSAAILSRLGRKDWISEDAEGFAARAAALAQDRGRLALEHNILRSDLAKSPICNGARLGRQLERVYRAVWRRWCQGQDRG